MQSGSESSACVSPGCTSKRGEQQTALARWRGPLFTARMKALLFIATLASLILTCCSTPEEPETKPLGENSLSQAEIREAKKSRVSFERHVKPILESKCVMCHHRAAMPGRMSLENRREAMKSGALGAFIVPGHPEKSLLIQNISATHQKVSVMPAVGDRLTSDEAQILRKWVSEGAEWPLGAAGTLSIRR
jgi:uncharacterized membrane protein